MHRVCESVMYIYNYVCEDLCIYSVCVLSPERFNYSEELNFMNVCVSVFCVVFASRCASSTLV